ncbi:MAG: outer membrane beta-barrel protein [Gammaproteobacteria bacterium]|jgi:polysaccharide biosynthesis protein VpsM|nr:outer membrane beta-barrel protein [Gammaproteobacteria bacterium]
MHKRYIGFLALGLAFGVTASPDPQGIDLGGGKLIPQLSVSTKHDDNIFSQSTSEESDTITSIKPSLQWLQEKDTTSLAVTYSGDYGKYWDNSDDDYDDHTVSFDGAFAASEYARVKVGASYGWLHDNRGEGSSEGINALSRGDPDEYEISRAGIDLDLGRESAMLGFRLSASQDDIEYQNNRNETVFRDRDEGYVAGRVYLNLSGGKTKLFAQASEKDISYDEDPLLGGKLDSDESGYSVGIEWEATGKTTGMISIGEVEKEFDSAARGEDDINTWDAEITWSPRTYSHFVFGASSAPRETNGTGNFIEAQDTSITWIHGWSDILNSTITLARGNDEYANDAREDDRDLISVGISYDWKRWITVGASYQYQERDSNQAQFDYEKNVILINFDMSL